MLPCPVIHCDNSRSTHRMNRPTPSTLAFSSRKCCVTRLTGRFQISRNVEAANRIPTSPAARRKPQFLLDTNEPNQNTAIAVTYSKQTTAQFSTRYKVTVLTHHSFPHHDLTPARIPNETRSSHWSLATSQCLFHETLNRQLLRSLRAANRASHATRSGSLIKFHHSPITPHQSLLTIHQSCLSTSETRP